MRLFTKSLHPRIFGKSQEKELRNDSAAPFPVISRYRSLLITVCHILIRSAVVAFIFGRVLGRVVFLGVLMTVHLFCTVVYLILCVIFIAVVLGHGSFLL